VPQLWRSAITPLIGNSFVDTALRIVAEIGAAIVVAMFGISLAGPTPTRGLRGGIFWAIIAMVLVFLFSRQFAFWIGAAFSLSSSTELIAWLVLFGGFGFLGLRFLRGKRFLRWSETMQDGGWFQATPYKKTQGLRVRRLTILGLLFLFGTGIYTMMIHQLVTAPKDWVMVTPFLPDPFTTITLLADVRFSVPLVLGALGTWVAYRAVNMPSFADFLIATEAEINKVSWTARAQLIKDTIVVLIVTFIITLFLLVVDLFWMWILSRELINVLPSDADKQSNKPADIGKLDY
jgi:preprotein translocase SecE subunit